MARPSRLSLPGVVHYVVQRGHDGSAIVRDDADADALVHILRTASSNLHVRLHAYAVGATALQLLLTPDVAAGVSQLMQALARRYAAAFNRRHGRSGTLWDGRFRSALVEDGPATLLLLRVIDGEPMTPADGEPLRSSRDHRAAGQRDPALADPTAYWQLGNTPFERESRYRQLLSEPIAASQRAELTRALRAGWAFGSADFLARMALAAGRPAQPRPRGRPRRLA